jgi:hypothetical protein
MRIKDIPKIERPREKLIFIKYGKFIRQFKIITSKR